MITVEDIEKFRKDLLEFAEDPKTCTECYSIIMNVAIALHGLVSVNRHPAHMVNAEEDYGLQDAQKLFEQIPLAERESLIDSIAHVLPPGFITLLRKIYMVPEKVASPVVAPEWVAEMIHEDGNG